MEGEVQEDLPLSRDSVAEMGGGKDFIVHVSGKSYFFKEVEGVQDWVEGINNIVMQKIWVSLFMYK